MLPPGHVAGGFLVGKAITYFNSSLSNSEQAFVLGLAMFFAFAPDLDMFWSFYNEKNFTIKSLENNHRKYISHTPVFWFIVALVFAIFTQNDLFALTVFLAALSHLILDSLQYGVMWLWPCEYKLYALKDAGVVKGVNKETGFLNYWIKAVRQYAEFFRLTFLSEIFVISLALYFWLK